MELTEKQVVALVFTSLQYVKGIKKPNDEDFNSFYQLYREAMFRYDIRKKELDKLAGKVR
jgi:hypothetical protein